MDQYSEKIRFIEKDERGRHVVKRSSDHRVIQVRDLVQVVGIVAPFYLRGFSIREKIALSSPRG